jgi:hypothetical protein
MRLESNTAEDTAPVPYKGIAFRRSYNDRPAVFHSEEKGRKLLWAARGGPDGPEFYDVTEADFEVQALEGGFGRDSIVGIDFPIVETTQGPIGKQLRERQEIFAVELESGPRAYPQSLFEKVFLANDQDGDIPILVAFDQGRNTLNVYPRTIDGRPVTFGTTGYFLRRQPVLYDRPTRSLWLPEADGLVCVNGPRKGTRLAVHRPARRTTWSEWLSAHPQTTILVGSNRSMPEDPIPTE